MVFVTLEGINYSITIRERHIWSVCSVRWDKAVKNSGWKPYLDEYAEEHGAKDYMTVVRIDDHPELLMAGGQSEHRRILLGCTDEDDDDWLELKDEKERPLLLLRHDIECAKIHDLKSGEVIRIHFVSGRYVDVHISCLKTLQTFTGGLKRARPE